MDYNFWRCENCTYLVRAKGRREPLRQVSKDETSSGIAILLVKTSILPLVGFILLTKTL